MPITLTAAKFRDMFPELECPADYTEPRINIAISIAAKFMNEQRWGTWFEYGLGLLTAHRITLTKKSQVEAEFGLIPGAAEGVLTSKSADKVSLSFDASSTVEEGGGFYNLTRYGQEWLRLAKMVGAGPLQVDAPSAQSGQSLYSGFAGQLYPF